MALAEAGLLSVVVPVADDTDLAGIGVFAATPDDTNAIMDDHPGGRAGIFRYQTPGPRLSRSMAPTIRADSTSTIRRPAPQQGQGLSCFPGYLLGSGLVLTAPAEPEG